MGIWWGGVLLFAWSVLHVKDTSDEEIGIAMEFCFFYNFLDYWALGS